MGEELFCTKTFMSEAAESHSLHVFAQLKQMQNFHTSNSVPLHVLIIKIDLLKHNRI